MMLTLIPWGHLLDRIGERIVLSLGLGMTAATGFAAASVYSMVPVGTLLVLGGMAAASTLAARISRLVRD
jgi:MFS family permease